METKDAILKRHSVRYFKDQAVKLETLKNIVALAQHAPSWVDSQPWKVYLATGETLKKLKDLHAKNVANGKTANPDWKPMHRVDWDAFPQTNMANLNLERSNFLTKPEQEIEWPMLQASFYHAPAIFYLTIPKKAPRWASFDLGAFAQTLMLAAKDQGVDTMIAYEIVKYPEEAREVLQISSDEVIAIGIAAGYPADSHVNQFKSSRVVTDNMFKVFE